MKKLIEVLIEDVLVFAYSGEDQIDEDYSIAHLERIAQTIRAADAADVEFLRAVAKEMEKAARKAGDDKRAEQLASLPSHLGLE